MSIESTNKAFASTQEVAVESANPAGTTVVTVNNDGESANYLEEDLNPTIVKIRPQDTPIDTITRMIGNTEKSESWEAGGWEIGTREVTDTVTAIAENTVTVQTPDMWLVGDTFVLLGVESAGGIKKVAVLVHEILRVAENFFLPLCTKFNVLLAPFVDCRFVLAEHSFA